MFVKYASCGWRMRRASSDISVGPVRWLWLLTVGIVQVVVAGYAENHRKMGYEHRDSSAALIEGFR